MSTAFLPLQGNILATEEAVGYYIDYKLYFLCATVDAKKFSSKLLFAMPSCSIRSKCEALTRFYLPSKFIETSSGYRTNFVGFFKSPKLFFILK